MIKIPQNKQKSSKQNKLILLAEKNEKIKGLLSPKKKKNYLT